MLLHLCYNILSDLVCVEYQLGSLKGTYVIEIDYEDFNAILTTSTGKYLMKVFRYCWANYKQFEDFDYDKLPKAFVHGDMMSTNLMLDKNGEIWVIDFSVSNFTARINEIIVICDDVALIVNDKKESERRVKAAFDIWCKKMKATDFEKESFQLIYDVANAINVLNPIYEIKTGNDTEETQMHLEAGLFALTLFK